MFNWDVFVYLALSSCSSLWFYLSYQVDINNLDDYVSLVVDAIVRTGIRRQMEAFRYGFNQVLLYSVILFL